MGVSSEGLPWYSILRRTDEVTFAMLLETSATLTDEILDLNDRLLGSTFAKAKRDFEASFQDAGRAINDKVRLYAKIGQALIEAKASQSDPFLAIESIVPWERFTQTVAEAEQLARTEDFDYLGFLGDSYPQLRRYMPTLLETFDFKAAPAAQNVLDAVSALRHPTPSGFAQGTGEQGAQINLRYGTDPGVLFYTHISDRFAPFHTKVINANVLDATHVLDGLLYHESDLRIEEHYTDTAGFTDHVFAMMSLLGFRFAPRIRDLADKRSRNFRFLRSRARNHRHAGICVE